jgi:hypothetical protein
MDMIIKSTNSVNDLESDLIPFIYKKGYANFKIDKEFPWIEDASTSLNAMLNDNVSGPLELLESYKQYEYILNVDKKALIDDLFKGAEGGGKKTLEEIKEQIEHYQQAYYEIMTLSEDEVNYRIFRVMAKKFKLELSDQATKIKDKILEATYNYCVETVNDVYKTYTMMQDKITHEPKDERELIDSKDFIAQAPAMSDANLETLKEVYRHFIMLEEFSYMYKDQDIESYWFMRVWPLKI